jgi:hypothetical protein
MRAVEELQEIVVIFQSFRGGSMQAFQVAMRSIQH